MLSRNSLIHGLRRDQLIEVLSISEFPVVLVENPFIQPKSTGKKPVIFNIDEFHVSIAPISSLKYDWSGLQLIQYSSKWSFRLLKQTW